MAEIPLAHENFGRPLVYELYANPLSGETIEAKSMECIDREAESHGFSSQEWEVVRRMIHTTADFGMLHDVRFSPNAIESGVKALGRGSRIFVDSNMIRSGVSLVRLRKACPRYLKDDIVCHVADPDVAVDAEANGLPRSIYAVRKARPILNDCIAVFGNAPVALMELSRMIMEEELRPALVVAMPVGFVHVVESKDELMALDVPYIALKGRRGGSPLAVSVIHALCSLASKE